MEFIILISIIIIFILNKYLKEKPKIIENKKEDKINYKEIYKPKKYIITKTELNFYKELIEIAKDLDLILFSQVSLYNIIEMRENLPNKIKYTYFNKIASKTIDFVLVSKIDCRIKLCIELDDYTHKRNDRIKRDQFINELFKELEINLLRYPVYKNYYRTTLKNKIKKNLIDHYYIN